MANIIDLISSWHVTVKMNDNISILFMLYQFVLMTSSLLAPGINDIVDSVLLDFQGLTSECKNLISHVRVLKLMEVQKVIFCQHSLYGFFDKGILILPPKNHLFTNKRYFASTTPLCSGLVPCRNRIS
jgi:hypothetical protein